MWMLSFIPDAWFTYAVHGIFIFGLVGYVVGAFASKLPFISTYGGIVKIIDSENEVNKATGKSVRFIKDYSLMELSIVDSPANELCNILSISKRNGQLVFKGMAAEIATENIFYCADSDSVFISTDASYDSPVTGKPATLIGWVESNDINKAKG